MREARREILRTLYDARKGCKANIGDAFYLAFLLQIIRLLLDQRGFKM